MFCWGEATKCLTKTKTIDGVVFHFPEIELENLSLLFSSSYRISQCQTNAKEHLDVNSDFAIQISKRTDGIIRMS